MSVKAERPLKDAIEEVMSEKAERPLKDAIEAMSVKAERPLKDLIEATFVEVPRNEAEIPSLGRTMDGPQFGGAEEVGRWGDGPQGDERAPE